MQIPRLNPIQNIAAIKAAIKPLSQATAMTSNAAEAAVITPHTEAIEKFVTSNKEKLSAWIKKLAPSIGLATRDDVAIAKAPVRNMLLHQVKNAKTSIYNSSLQCVGAGIGFSAAKWGADIVNYLFHTSVSLSPEFSLIARTVPISVFFNSLFRILENRRTLQVAEKNLAFLR